MGLGGGNAEALREGKRPQDPARAQPGVLGERCRRPEHARAPRPRCSKAPGSGRACAQGRARLGGAGRRARDPSGRGGSGPAGPCGWLQTATPLPSVTPGPGPRRARARRGPGPRGPARARQAGPLLGGARRSQHMVGGGAPPRPAETGCSRYRIRDRQRRGAGARAAARRARAQAAGVGGGGRVWPGCPRRGRGWGAGALRAGRPVLTRRSQFAVGSGPRPKGLNLSHVTERLIRRGRPSLRLIGSLLGFILFPSNLVSWFYYFTCLKV